MEYLDNDWKYIARDEDRRLFVYKIQPKKGCIHWECTCDNCLLLNRQLNIVFPMVKWEDEKPWLIEDLKKLEVVEEYN